MGVKELLQLSGGDATNRLITMTFTRRIYSVTGIGVVSLVETSPKPGGTTLQANSFLRLVAPMIREMREKLGREIDQLSHELNILLPQAIAQAVALGDLRENSEYKAALERQQFVQARLGQLHQRLSQLGQLANTEAPLDRVGLGSRVTVLDLETNETDTYVVVLAEMMDIDAGHISLASPLGRALAGGKVGEEVGLRLPTSTRRVRIIDLVTVHQAEGNGVGNANGKR
jgi:transcription elongation factor GreA